MEQNLAPCASTLRVSSHMLISRGYCYEYTALTSSDVFDYDKIVSFVTCRIAQEFWPTAVLFQRLLYID